MKSNRSWFSLLAFCTTSALVAALACAVLLATASVAFAGSDPSAQAEPSPSTAALTSAASQ